MVNLTHLRLCDTAAKHLGDNPVCALVDKNLSGITQCANESLRLQPCGLMSRCEADDTRSFAFDGDFVDVGTCVANKGLAAAFALGILCLLVALVLAGWFGVVRPLRRRAQRAARVAEMAATRPARAVVPGDVRRFAGGV